MRAICIYELATGRWLRAGFVGLTYDPATEGMVELDSVPDLVLEMYDAASPTKRRPATPQEQDAALAGGAARTADRAVTDPAMRATLVWCLSRSLGRAPNAGEIAAAAAEWRTIYRQVIGR